LAAFSGFQTTGVLTSSEAFARRLGLTDAPTTVILLEGLDRSHHPRKLLEALAALVPQNGLLFLTALLSSGFEMRILQGASLYLFPPDKAHCLSSKGIEEALKSLKFDVLEASTPGVLDCDSILQHRQAGVSFSLSSFEQAVLESPEETRHAFQTFLQQAGLSSFGRFVVRRR
jgi:hypothetical protein